MKPVAKAIHNAMAMRKTVYKLMVEINENTCRKLIS